MVCLFHGDYGPPDPTFIISGSASGLHAWAVSPKLLKEARNLGEAEAIQRHLLQGQTVAWCDQGYAWVEQDAIGWFYIAALLFVVAPYLLVRFGAKTTLKRLITGRDAFPGAAADASRRSS
jgi:hypothetical protein